MNDPTKPASETNPFLTSSVFLSILSIDLQSTRLFYKSHIPSFLLVGKPCLCASSWNHWINRCQHLLAFTFRNADGTVIISNHFFLLEFSFRNKDYQSFPLANQTQFERAWSYWLSQSIWYLLILLPQPTSCLQPLDSSFECLQLKLHFQPHVFLYTSFF
jgi:hypothetical protein